MVPFSGQAVKKSVYVLYQRKQPFYFSKHWTITFNVVYELLSGKKTQAEIASEYGVRPQMSPFALLGRLQGICHVLLEVDSNKIDLYYKKQKCLYLKFDQKMSWKRDHFSKTKTIFSCSQKKWTKKLYLYVCIEKKNNKEFIDGEDCLWSWASNEFKHQSSLAIPLICGWYEDWGVDE